MKPLVKNDFSRFLKIHKIRKAHFYIVYLRKLLGPSEARHFFSIFLFPALYQMSGEMNSNVVCIGNHMISSAIWNN